MTQEKQAFTHFPQETFPCFLERSPSPVNSPSFVRPPSAKFSTSARTLAIPKSPIKHRASSAPPFCGVLPLKKKEKTRKKERERETSGLTFAVANVAEHHVRRVQRSGCILSRGLICTEISRDVGAASWRVARGGGGGGSAGGGGGERRGGGRGRGGRWVDEREDRRGWTDERAAHRSVGLQSVNGLTATFTLTT